MCVTIADVGAPSPLPSLPYTRAMLPTGAKLELVEQDGQDFGRLDVGRELGDGLLQRAAHDHAERGDGQQQGRRRREIGW